MYNIEISPAADKELERINNYKEILRITQCIEELKNFPFVSNILKLEGEDETWRKRVGNWRITFHIGKNENKISIFHIRHRKEAY